MQASGGWGKPLKKSAQAPFKEESKDAFPPVSGTSNTTKPSTASNSNTASTSTTASATTTASTNTSAKEQSKVSTKSEPYVQKVELQPIQLVARSKEGIYLVNDKAQNYIQDISRIICEEATISQFSKDGDILAFANALKIGLYIFSETNGLTYDLANCLAMHFSPTLKYLVTIDKRENKHFLTIFESRTLTKVHEFETTRYKKETWPQLKFVGDDELAFRSLAPGKIDVLDPQNKFQVVKTIETKPFDFFGVSAKRENLIIVCVNIEHTAGYEKNEGRIDVYSYDNLTTKPVVSKVIDKAHEVNLFFSPDGKNLLAWTQTFTDKTGQSYYGEHVLFYLDMKKKILKRVPTYKGPIHDVAWNPDGSSFIAISGFMPASSVLFTSECVPTFEFGQHHRNTIKWSPFSKFILLGGFGNLSGDMDIWETSTLQKVGSCKSNCAVSCQWSPDARRILTGVLNPRLRVDNGYKVFKYNGEQLISVDFSSTELYEVIWRPGKYTDRPITPVKKDEKKQEDAPKLFRPSGSGSFAAQLKAQKTTKTNGRFLQPDEYFGNEANLESIAQEEAPKKKKRIRKKKDKNAEENKDDDEDGEDDK